MSGAALSGVLAVHSRVAEIESRLGVSSARGVDRRSTAGSFDAVLASHAPTAAAPISGVGSTHTGSGDLAGVPFADLFTAAGQRHGIDPALLAAVADAESGFDPSAVSRAGAQGLMQLMPATAAGLGVTNSFDPAQAVDGAARLLAGHLRTFGTPELALAAYNAGPGAVNRFGGIPPYDETQAYVPKVLQRYQELSR